MWSLVAVLAATQFANAGLWYALGPFEEPRGLVVAAQVVSYLVLFGAAVLIMVAVQQEALVGVSQDWLIRPIRRGALLCAKVLFILIAIHVPMLLADIAHGTAAGFSLHATVVAALSRSACIALIVDLPVFAVATMTKNLVQAAGTLLAVWVVVAVGIAVGFLVRGSEPPPFAASGIQWMTPAFWLLLAVCASVGIVSGQYRHRATSRARAIMLTAALLAPLLSFSTWGSAFSVQRWLSSDPEVAQPIAIAFEPIQGRAAPRSAPPSAGTVFLPIRVAGIAPGGMVMSDRTFISLVGHDGTTLYHGRSTVNLGYGDDFPVRAEDRGEVHMHQRITVPGKIYEKIRAQPVRMEIDYSLTLFRLAAANSLSASNGHGNFAAFGRCQTQIDADDDDVELGCTKTGTIPTCVAIALENPKNGKRNPETPYCAPDYAPLRPHLLPDALSHFGADVKFHDIQQVATYPVDGSQLAEARVSLKSYQPVAHVTRHLVISDIRLGDWAANVPVGATQVR